MYLSFNNSHSDNILSNVVIKYAGSSGSGALYVYKSKLTINNAVITDNGAAINSTQSELTVSNSIMHNNMIPWMGDTLIDAGVDNNNNASYSVDARNNWWGSADGPCPWRQLIPSSTPIWTVDMEELCGSRVLVDTGVVYEPWLTSEPVFTEPEPEPIIFVPGITACINLKVLTDLEESSYDWEIFGQYYQGLIKTIEAAGFTQGENFFIGCYDWRKTNGYNPDAAVNSGEEYLKYWIDLALENSSSTKVDIVAHSMGGLLSRSYIQGSRYRNDVNNFIMLGTPNYGSTDSYNLWEGGEIPEKWNEFKWILRTYLTYLKFKGLNITNVATVHEYIPSIKQLLSTYDYIINKETELILSNNLMNEQNSWLKELNAAENLEKLTERTTNVKIINGDGVSTRNTITVGDRSLADIVLNKWPDGRPDEDIIDNRDNGDGTVLSSSVLISGIASSTVAGAEHSALPDQAALLVLQELGLASGQVFSSPEINDMLIVMVASPVDPIVTTADNKQVGGSVNEIANAQYFSAGDSGVKIIAIPNPPSGNFTVSLTGNNGGSYNMVSIYSNSGSTVSSETSGEVNSGQNIVYSSNLQSGASPNLGELLLPVEESEPENVPSGGAVPIWLLQEMSGQPKILGIKIYQEES
ncbi:hypothetical protein COT99_00730, partial [Candidatus Falkowbacteria bacterium CG10_big_fil_rev_8_21_14_0_10_43_10]